MRRRSTIRVSAFATDPNDPQSVEAIEFIRGAVPLSEFTRAIDAALVRALELLAIALHLSGCGNRVNLITARVAVSRARLALERGDDARTPLQQAVDLCVHIENIPGNEPWHAIRAEVDQLQAEL